MDKSHFPRCMEPKEKGCGHRTLSAFMDAPAVALPPLRWRWFKRCSIKRFAVTISPKFTVRRGRLSSRRVLSRLLLPLVPVLRATVFFFQLQLTYGSWRLVSLFSESTSSGSTNAEKTLLCMSINPFQFSI
jgi:hypothetical protein